MWRAGHSSRWGVSNVYINISGEGIGIAAYVHNIYTPNEKKIIKKKNECSEKKNWLWEKKNERVLWEKKS